MEFTEIEWEGFPGVEFEFEGLPAKVIRPRTAANGKWFLKTEYFGRFADPEIELLKRGWTMAFNQNFNRWAEDRDLERKVRFISFVSERFGLNEKCTPVGLSCGGMYAVKVAALCPEKISSLYLDAPVLNLLSCPFALGDATRSLAEEFTRFTGKTLADMLAYREHPIDRMGILAEHRIPIVLVAGDSDHTVPFRENGAILEKFYRERGCRIEVFLKPGCDHHPHGLEDPTVIADLIEEMETR